MTRLLLSDLPPALLASLRASGHINGTGPRTIKLPLVGIRFRSPCSIPTPGGKAAAEQHDLDYLVGGTESERIEHDREYIAALRTIAASRHFAARGLMLALAWGFEADLKLDGKNHWHPGKPRDTQDLWKLALPTSQIGR